MLDAGQTQQQANPTTHLQVQNLSGEVPSNGDASVDGESNGSRVLFGTFTGVFTPTLLTIVGVIMYVRIGWAVGNAGLIGTWLVMLLAMGITAATGLSLSSVATNTRIGPGGPYAILSRSLGYEIGGAIGVPLFLTRPLGVAMYVFGFREGWLWIFPDHPAMAVDLAVFALLAGISYISADLAFRIQFLIMAVIVGSLISMFASPVTFNPVAEIHMWGDYPGFPENGFKGTDFWGVFAVFFPATTGILAGANMSGDLKDPRRAIPVGTLWAIGISSIIYVAVAWWITRAGTLEELLNNYTLAIDKALWPPIVLAGLLGATASSALAGLVGGPRILMAMGQNKLIPYSEKMAETGDDGNPRAAVVVTAILTLGCIMVRDLNTIAPLVTMFFLITYCMLNVVVLVESSLGLVSYRPTLWLPRIVPLLGMIGCIFSMFIVNPTFGLISVGMVFGFYFWMKNRGVSKGSEDVRSSAFVAMAQWAASRVTAAERENKRAWKPEFLVPVDDPEELRGQYQLLLDLTRPDGSVTLLGMTADKHASPLRKRLLDLSESFRADGIQSSSTVLNTDDSQRGVIAGIEVLQAAFFRPNLLFVTFQADGRDDLDLGFFARTAEVERVGMLVVAMHGKAGFGQRECVNMWVRPAPGTWDAEVAFGSGNLNLNLLTGFRLMREWKAEINLITVVESQDDVEAAEAFLGELCDLARYRHSKVNRLVLVGPYWEALDAAPVADVNIVGIPPDPDAADLVKKVERLKSTLICVRDSGRESALV